MKKEKILCVLGPTASGKTGLGVALAKQFNGEIISADSRQIYIGMDIGTGKEGEPAHNVKCAMAGEQPMRMIDSIPQYAVDLINPNTRYSVAEWKQLAEKLIENIIARGKLPIIVGGTHMYVQALEEDYTLPASDKAELEIRDELEKKSLTELLKELKSLDNETYKKIDHQNKRRVIRALAATKRTGVPFSAQAKKHQSQYEYLNIAIDLPRAELYKKIDKRVDERIKIGMIEEVENLLKEGVNKQRLVDFGLEYKFIALYLTGKMEKEEMTQKLKFAIHGFARRQLTWMRNRMSICWVKDMVGAIKITRRFLKS